MKAFTIIAKVLAALAAIAGVVYVIATYGDKIVAWAKKMLGNCKCCCGEECECCCDGECTCEGDCEKCECEEEAAEEAPIVDEPAEEVVVEEGEPVAEESDFEA